MNGSIHQIQWHGQKAWALENDTLRTVVVPEMGAKLVSLTDKRSGLEWLAGPADRPFRPVQYGADFVQQDMSGWDEMFPTIVACTYPAPGQNHGAPLPDHGEVWALPWTLNSGPAGTLRLSVMGKALPYRLTRTLAYSAADTLAMHYILENLGQEPLPYIWAAHPQFLCGDQAEIRFPHQVDEVCNTLPAEWGWGEPETRFSWPEATSPAGQPARLDRTGPATLRQGRKFFALPETRAAWAGLIRQPSQDWLHMAWDADRIPYLSVWVDEGAFQAETVAAPEPTTGYYDSLAVAWTKRQVTIIESGDTQTWTLTIRLGTGAQPFPTDIPNRAEPEAKRFTTKNTENTERDLFF
ncbi:MAG: hypothetical protein KA003_19280 [Caldilineaceae bacterium]|nr:hypothetical protein [Caldilineaceae bacterium]MBP8109370.1 hypothetical protein [Caldilineaceae bacterium]